MAILHAQPTPTATLLPAKAFDLRSAVPTVTEPYNVHYFRAHAAGLFFAVSPGFNTLRSRIIHVDFLGKHQKTINLPADAELYDFDVDQTGNIYALLSGQDRDNHSVVMVYGPDGGFQKALSTPVPAGFLTIVNGAPFVTGRAGKGYAEISRFDRTPTVVASVSLQRPQSRLLMAALPDGRLVIAERTAALLHFIDLARTSVVSFAPRVPEMAWLADLAPGDVIRNVAFSGMASAPNGQIYVLISHYKMAEGAPVMYFHMNGNLTNTLRCQLPQFKDEQSTNNPAGHMIASFIGVARGANLVLVSSSGKVAIYSL